ncbi:hypothetical protein AGMMS50276_30880 [Synergistales bacterium]|nr:hypothetical protein AGMMS50276_30880 [Synergistales bacterium]
MQPQSNKSVDTCDGLIKYRSDLAKFTKAAKIAGEGRDFQPQILSIWPIVTDWSDNAGFLSYYFWQDLWAAKKIFERKPSSHFDIASRIDGFVAHLLTFMPVTLIDIRPLPYEIEGLDFVCTDATDMSVIKDDCIESLSSLCAIEHFGLGRYGDPIDPEACFKAMSEMERVLSPGGRLYIAVPVGVEGVRFNAHRIFYPRTIISALSRLSLLDFSVVDTRSSSYMNTQLGIQYMEHADPADYENEQNDEELIGLFEFEK